MFGAKKGTNYDGLSIANLPPAIYKGGKLVEVKKDRSTAKDGGEGTPILTLLFEFPEGMHQITEWDITNETKGAANKAENLVKRLGHILRQFGIPQEVIDANQSSTFGELCNWFLTTLGQAHQGVNTLELKLVGNVYNGKATSDIPGYIPFLANSARTGYKPLAYSATELSANSAYYKHNNAQADTETTSGGPDMSGFGSTAPKADVNTDF